MPRRLRVACVALALGGTLMVAPSSAVATPAAASAPRPQPDPAATQLAAEQSISLAEAEKRLRWQQRAGDLKTRLRASLGIARFGGLWIDPDDGDRLKVGIVGAVETDRAAVAATATVEGVADSVDVVRVRYSEARLLTAMDQISGRLAAVNKKASWPIQLSHWARGNRLELVLPQRGALTLAQQALISQVSSRYGDMAQMARYRERPVGDACQFPYCDPPLRAGVRINGPAGGFCTGGFLARSKTDNKLYMFTAGHCAVAGGTSTWWTRFTNGSRHDLGRVHNGKWNSDGDMAIIRIVNETGWRPRAWVVVYASSDTTANYAYSITRDNYSTEGQRICKTGAGARTDCGRVTRLGVTVTYSVTSATGAVRTQTVRGLGQASYCRGGGDSGAPVYANHTAYGIHVAGGSTCVAYYQGIRKAETAMNVNVAHEAR